MRVGGEISLDKEIGHLEEVRFFCQLLNWNASVLKDSFSSVDEGDLGGTGHGVCVPWVIGS